MRSFLQVAFAVALFWAAGFSCQAQTSGQSNLAPARRETIISDIDRTVRQRFAHWQGTQGLDYDAAFTAFRADALAAPDRMAFSRRARAFVAGLSNGHTAFHDPALYQGDPGGLGFSLTQLEDGWTVTRSRRPEVPAGSVISALDGQPFDAFYSAVAPQLSASSDRARRSALSAFPSLFPLRFTLIFADGHTTDIDRSVPPSVAAPPPAAPMAHRWITPNDVAYIKIATFSDPAAEREAQATMRSLYGRARIVILDVRGNGGGVTPSRLGRQSLGGDWRSWRSTAPTTPPDLRSRPRPVAPRYILLVDRNCASACEDFAMPFSLSPKAILIGETTLGSSGQPTHVEWEEGMQLWVGARRQWFPDGRPFEGVGVAPDIPVPLRPTDFTTGATDRVIECAIRLSENPSATCA